MRLENSNSCDWLLYEVEPVVSFDSSPRPKGGVLVVMLGVFRFALLFFGSTMSTRSRSAAAGFGEPRIWIYQSIICIEDSQPVQP